MTPFRGLRCLRFVETLPEDNIYDSRGRLERGVEDCWTTLRLGDPPGGGDFDIQVEPEVQRANDAVTVVLPARGRVRFGGQLRAPRVAAVTLAVIAVGIPIVPRPASPSLSPVSQSRQSPHALSNCSESRTMAAVGLSTRKNSLECLGSQGARSMNTPTSWEPSDSGVAFARGSGLM